VTVRTNNIAFCHFCQKHFRAYIPVCHSGNITELFLAGAVVKFHDPSRKTAAAIHTRHVLASFNHRADHLKVLFMSGQLSRNNGISISHIPPVFVNAPAQFTNRLSAASLFVLEGERRQWTFVVASGTLSHMDYKQRRVF
jgi:hypothetical protein